MIDLPTLESWLAKLRFTTQTVEGEGDTLRIKPREGGDDLPPFFVQWSPNWVVLSILPILTRGEYRAEDLGRRLLMANRDMRLAKFALDSSRSVVLCAELPTESLDYSEVEDALSRMVRYARDYRRELIGEG